MSPESSELAKVWLAKAIELTPFATEYRYPGEELEPSQKEASRALSLADDLTTWILG